jgi:hypothetical protein
MISQAMLWRSFTKDRIFLTLAAITIVTFVLVLLLRRPSLETSAVPFDLALLFFVINCFFAVLSVRREPLLAYMLLTSTILSNATLLFFFRYLLMIQTS